MLKLGIIGLSEGNGHPYSWSAICNGYDKEVMGNCGFPVIPRYLEKQKWPESMIDSAKVTSVWTQDEAFSRHIAQASRIPNIATSIESMIKSVDAVLLARDDAENHLLFAEPVLRAGLPIYIDKPVALSLSALRRLYELEQYSGQLFTCSALRYSPDLMLSAQDRSSLGEIRYIIAFTPKSWEKYAVHIVEPVLNILSDEDTPITFSPVERDCRQGRDSALTVTWSSGIKTSFFALGDALGPLAIRVHGTDGWKELVFQDSFTAFKNALEKFVLGVSTNSVASPKQYNFRVVELLEKGMK